MAYTAMSGSGTTADDGDPLQTAIWRLRSRGCWTDAAALLEPHAGVPAGALQRTALLTERCVYTETGWAEADEALRLARESGQRTELVFGLAGLAWLQARRGREQDCRACAAEARTLSHELGARLHEIWAAAALGELELGLGEEATAVGHLERQRDLLAEAGITDVDLSPAAELVDAYLRLGRGEDAARVAVLRALAID